MSTIPSGFFSSRSGQAGLHRLGTLTTLALTFAVSAVITACGGGNGASGNTSTADSASSSDMLVSASLAPSSDSDAYRFLTQASFGPSPDDVARVKAIGYSRWIDEQYDMHLQNSHLDTVVAAASALHLSKPDPGQVTFSWWTHAVKDPAQLRQRVAFALSEIFVVSSTSVESGRALASYLDMLTNHADADFRTLLEAVAMHPAMGLYLSHLANRKEDPTTGRVPDENFAREIMQLFTIGLYELDDSANPIKINGLATETYSASDISGLAKVFTGYSWYRPASKASLPETECFWRTTNCNDAELDYTNMSAYSNFHSTSAKQFLGVTIPQQTTANPALSIQLALDRLANHRNTAPFISKQLIQRLVTSNPSAQYVADITHVFRASQGNIKAVVKAILLHKEARIPDGNALQAYGKLREPVLRFSHLLRAIPHHSFTYDQNVSAGVMPFYQAMESTDPGTALGQTPMGAPSVFNFFRPGYRPPQTQLPTDMVSPEMQITNETSVLGYVNTVSNALNRGWGQWITASPYGYDIQFDFSQWNALVNAPADLLSAVSATLLGHPLDDDVLSEATAAITAMPATTTTQKRQRIMAAVLLVAVSPSFVVQQ